MHRGLHKALEPRQNGITADGCRIGKARHYYKERGFYYE
jgi:hypothetical protein